MKLSIIMPVYNVEKYITRCLDSIINQSNMDFELIIVDDGSKDDSINIAKSKIKQLKNAKIITKLNGGLSDARNFGLKYAKGDYITFLDSDDNIEFNYVDTIINTINEHEMDLVIFGYYVDNFVDNKIINTETILEKFQVSNIKKHESIQIHNNNCIGYAWNKVYKKTIINKYKLQYEKGTSYIEDIIFNESYIEKCNQVVVLNKALYHYNQYNNINSLGKKLYIDMLSLDLRASKCFENILKSLNYEEELANNLSKNNLTSRFLWGIRRALYSNNKSKKELLDNYSNYYKNNKDKFYINNKKNKFIFKMLEHKLYFINKLLLKIYDKKDLIKKLIPNQIKMYLKFIFSPSDFYEKEKNISKIFIILSVNYGNLGDCLISKAQEKYLKDLYPNKKVIKINSYEVFDKVKSLRKSLKKGDLITFIGGGNFGNQYKELEISRKFASKYLKKYKKIYFPQTITCEKDETSFLKKSKKVYDSKNNLIMLREKESFDKLDSIYKNSKNICCPDIVLYLKDHIKQNENKDYYLLCLRNDKEKNINVNNNAITNSFENKKIYYTDTQIHNNNMTNDVIEYELNKIINIFSNSKLVVTDRLHGMILSYITGTPFIAFDNKNKKISRIYNMWLKESNGIVLSSSSELSKDIINTIQEKKNNKINNKKDFEIMKKEIYSFNNEVNN